MLELKYLGSETSYEIEFSKDVPHVCTILGDLPSQTDGFTLSRIGMDDDWDYSSYTTVYRELESGIQFSDDGSVYVEPEVVVNKYTVRFECGEHLALSFESVEDIEENTLLSEIEYPMVTADNAYRFIGWDITEGKVRSNLVIMALEESLEDVKETVVTSLNNIQQQVISAGVTVTLSDGSQETFTLTDNDQISLMELQALASTGATMIPWHNDNHSEGCKYYSLQDFMLLSNAVIPYVTYHVTYFRDLRRYVMNMSTFEEVENAYYGMLIPEEFQSDVLKTLLAQMAQTE